MYSSTYIWAKVLGHMEQQLTPAVVSTWFDDTEVLELTDQKLVLFSPSTFRKDMIVSRCAVYIQEALKDQHRFTEGGVGGFVDAEGVVVGGLLLDGCIVVHG